MHTRARMIRNDHAVRDLLVRYTVHVSKLQTYKWNSNIGNSMTSNPNIQNDTMSKRSIECVSFIHSSPIHPLSIDAIKAIKFIHLHWFIRQKLSGHHHQRQMPHLGILITQKRKSLAQPRRNVHLQEHAIQLSKL
jgi:hypothetical protein